MCLNYALTRVGVEELFKPVGHLIIQLVVSNIEVGYIGPNGFVL